MKSASRMTRATSAAHQLARRYRLLIAISLVWLWWALVPPTDAIELAVGLTVVLVIHRMLAPEATTPTAQHQVEETVGADDGRRHPVLLDAAGLGR